MARARNIKPGFFTNEDLVELDFATRLLFAGLWTVADREGRLQDRPKKIKIDVFPADNLDIDAMLQALHDRKFITRYEVNGGKFIQISSWAKHQNPHHTEKASEIPGIDGDLTVKEPLKPSDPPKQDGENLADSLIPDSLIPEKEKGVRKRSPRFDAEGIELPEWLPSELWAAWVRDRKARGKPITEAGAAEQLKTLADYRDIGHEPERVIRHAISSGHQGLFPPPRIVPTARADPVVTTVASKAADSTAELLRKDAEHRAEVARQRAERLARESA